MSQLANKSALVTGASSGIGAETTEIKASHVSFISHPNQVVNPSEAAVTAAMN